MEGNAPETTSNWLAAWRPGVAASLPNIRYLGEAPSATKTA